MKDNDGFSIFIGVALIFVFVVVIVMAWLYGEANGADDVANAVCIADGFDLGKWIDGEVVCQTLTVIKGG